MEKIHLYKYKFYGKNFPILLFFFFKWKRIEKNESQASCYKLFSLI